MKKKRRLLLLLPALLLCLILPGFVSSLRLVRYEVSADGLAVPLRIALVTDLHSCAYGEGQRILLDAMEESYKGVLAAGCRMAEVWARLYVLGLMA